ncbi:MAG: hypothetical protein ACKOXM_04740 [Agromyces sp.]
MPQQPTGRPLPAYIYRRRRLAVFGGAIVLLLLVLLIAHPWTGGGAPAAATPSPSQSTVITDTSNANGAEVLDCQPNQIQVVARTDAETYAAGQLPQLSVQVSNTSSTPCLLNVGTAQQIFTITMGSEVVWASTDCQTEASDSDLIIEPGQPLTSEPLQWDRTRSNPGTCTVTAREPVPAAGASYSLAVSIGGIGSATPASFTLN